MERGGGEGGNGLTDAVSSCAWGGLYEVVSSEMRKWGMGLDDKRSQRPERISNILMVHRFLPLREPYNNNTPH